MSGAPAPALAQPPATAILQAEGYLSTTPTAVLRQFGVDVALDGDTAAVGAPRASDPGSRGGRVYILTRIGPSWVQEAVLTPPPAEPGDPTSLKFGYVLGISGDTIVAGSTGNAFSYGGGSGVFVYRRGSSGWQLEATLRADDAFATSASGSTSLSTATRSSSARRSPGPPCLARPVGRRMSSHAPA